MEYEKLYEKTEYEHAHSTSEPMLDVVLSFLSQHAARCILSADSLSLSYSFTLPEMAGSGHSLSYHSFFYHTGTTTRDFGKIRKQKFRKSQQCPGANAPNPQV